MIIIVSKGHEIAKFEKWDANKAMDWITAKGLVRKDKIFALPNVIWLCEPLP